MKAAADGASLDDLRAFVGRFCALPTGHAYTATVLWAAHAHVLDAFDSTPRLAFLSPEPGSGKTPGARSPHAPGAVADARGQPVDGKPRTLT